MTTLRRTLSGTIAAAALLLAAPLTSDLLPTTSGTELRAIGWHLYVDYGLFAICATACPSGAEGSEYCCWMFPESVVSD
jgi:hypothetical protein